MLSLSFDFQIFFYICLPYLEILINKRFTIRKEEI